MEISTHWNSFLTPNIFLKLYFKQKYFRSKVEIIELWMLYLLSNLIRITGEKIIQKNSELWEKHRYIGLMIPTI